MCRGAMRDGSRPEFASKDKAKVVAWRREAQMLRNQGRSIGTSSQSVEQFLWHWLEGSVNISQTTRQTYEKRIKWLVPYIGRRKLSALKPEHVQSAYAAMLQELSPRSVYTTHGTLRQALQKAVQWDRIPRNPTDHVDPPSVENPEMQTLSEQELVRLLTTSVDDDWHPLWVLLGTTGMRLGEALALKWQYVGDDTVRIVRTIRAERGRGLVSVKPKTKNSNRTIELTMQGIRALKKQKASQAERRLGAGPVWQNDDFVFTNDDGSAIHRERVARAFTRALKRADVRPIRIHDLRHTFATLQLEQGVNVKKISEMLGHSNVGITLGIYSHVTKQMDREAVDRMEEMLSRAGF
jgi:integrase